MMKNKTSLILLLILILSNVAWFWHHYSNKHKASRRGGPGRIAEMIVKEANFNDAQKAEFQKIFDANATQVKSTMDSIGALKKSYIENMIAGKNNDSMQLNYSKKIGSMVAEMNSNSYQSLMIEARKICKPEQLAKYDSVVKNILTRMPGRGNRK